MAAGVAPDAWRTVVAASAGAAAPSRIRTGRSSRRGRGTAWMLRAGALGGRCHLLVLALTELLDDLLRERRKVIGVAAGRQTFIDDDLLVDPVAARVADVGLERRPRGDRAALEHVGLDERPRAVADHADRLGLLHERAHEAHGVVVHAQEVRVRHSTGEQQRVVVGGVGVLDLLVDLDLVALVEVVEGLHLTGLERHELDVGALALEALHRLLELYLLHAVGEQRSYLLAIELAHCRLLSSDEIRYLFGTEGACD